MKDDHKYSKNIVVVTVYRFKKKPKYAVLDIIAQSQANFWSK